MTVTKEIQQLRDEIYDIQNFSRVTLADGSYKFFQTVGSAREAIKARQRRLKRLGAK